MDHINVTLLLAGGHRTGLRLDARDPLLGTLLSAMQAKSKSAELPVFNLPVEGGAKSLIFSAVDLIGVVTDPPLARARKEAPRVEKSRYLLVENCLDQDWHGALLDMVLREETNFVDSTVSTSDPDYRRSKVLHQAEGVRRLFEQRITDAAPEWMKELGMPSFTPASVEVQVTAHGDGNYFKLHNDSGSPDAATRGLTFVYYLFNEPQAFSGGEFRLYDSVIADGEVRCGPVAETIVPKNNSVLVFAPHCHHEVLPVSVPSGRFRDGRFTVNGWLRRAA
jgi:Rps23 Pro-64 3,4-dihydroxylase Tpa1-like proline 4-hydroxylase